MTKKKSVVVGLDADKVIFDDAAVAPSKEDIRAIEHQGIKAIFFEQSFNIDPQYARKMSCNGNYN
jgi:hypothetical protein